MIKRISSILLKNGMRFFFKDVQDDNISYSEQQAFQLVGVTGSKGILIEKTHIFAYPLKPMEKISNMHRIEKNLASQFKLFSSDVLFHESNVQDDYYFFGTAYLMQNHLKVVGDVEGAGSKFLHTVCFYPHVDIARTAYLFDKNKYAIDCSDLDVYFNPGRYSKIS